MTEWLVYQGHSLEEEGLNSIVTSWDFSVTVEWPMTTHMLFQRPPINPDSK